MRENETLTRYGVTCEAELRASASRDHPHLPILERRDGFTNCGGKFGRGFVIHFGMVWHFEDSPARDGADEGYVWGRLG